LRFALVVSKYNDFVTDRLQAGALSALAGAGVTAADITVVRYPRLRNPAGGAARGRKRTLRRGGVPRLPDSGRDGALRLSSRPRFAHGLTTAAAATGIPMAFGVLTTNSVEEALARAGDGRGNKGRGRRRGDRDGGRRGTDRPARGATDGEVVHTS